jgi:nitrogen fixation protein FixH
MAWPWAMAAVLALTVVANVALLVSANAPGAAQVEPDYYRRALAWDSTQAERARSAALGWRAEAGFGAATASGTPLSLSLRDAAGAPVEGALVEVDGLHNLAAGGPVRWRLVERSPGLHEAFVRPGRAGRWELRVTATRGAERFVAVLHAEAGAP